MKKYKTKIAEQHIPNINKVDVYDMDGNVIGSISASIYTEDGCIIITTIDSHTVESKKVGVSCSIKYSKPIKSKSKSK